jgi:chorismate mutase
MNIAELRRKIDDVDKQIVTLISERAAAAQEIGRLKQATSRPVYDSDREREVIVHVRAVNPGPLSPEEIQHIYERIIDATRAL